MREVNHRAQPFAVLVDPLGEPWPFGDQRLVCEVDEAIMGDEQASGDELVEDSVDPVAERVVEVLERKRASRRWSIVGDVDRAEQESAGECLAVAVEQGGVDAVRGVGDRTSETSGVAVVGDGEVVAASASPRLEAGRARAAAAGATRWRGRRHEVGERRFDRQTTRASRAFDDLVELGVVEDSDEDGSVVESLESPACSAHAPKKSLRIAIATHACVPAVDDLQQVDRGT